MKPYCKAVQKYIRGRKLPNSLLSLYTLFWDLSFPLDISHSAGPENLSCPREMGDRRRVNHPAIFLHLRIAVSLRLCPSHQWLLGSIPQNQTNGKGWAILFLHAFISASRWVAGEGGMSVRFRHASQSRLMLSDVAELGLSPLPLTATWPISASNAPSLQRHMLDSSRKNGLSFTGRGSAICISAFMPSLVCRYPPTQLGRPLTHANECLSPCPRALCPRWRIGSLTLALMDG